MRNLFKLIIAFSFVVGCSDKNDPTSSSGDPSNVGPASFLSAANYDNLIVEIQYVTGFQPSATTVSKLSSFLIDRLNKPVGISIVQKEVSSPGKTVLTLNDVMAFESSKRTQRTSGKTLTAYFLFADADYSENSGSSKILGIAYGTSSMIIFEKTIREFSGGLSQPSVTTLETTVVHHEFGHILGLVDRGTPMTTSHIDSANGKHCNDKDCLMYYTAETSDVVGNLLGGSIPQLTSTCLDDLRANGGR